MTKGNSKQIMVPTYCANVVTGRIEKKQNVSKVDSLLRELKSTAKCYFSETKSMPPIKKLDAPFKCKVLTEKYKNSIWIVDDEAYFPLDLDKYRADRNPWVWVKKDEPIPVHLKYRERANMHGRILTVWAAISHKGMSELVIKPGAVMNQTSYRECLQEGLVPFVKRYHSRDNTILWPTLATCRYAEATCDYMIESRINFVEKYENPGNLPKCRPLEDYLAILKFKVYEGNWKAKTLQQLEKRIREKAATISPQIVSEIAGQMKDLPGNLKYIQRHGLF